jgi:hypothetical protein
VFGWLKNSKQRPKELLPIDASLFESGGARLYNALRAHWASLDENYTPHLAYAEVSALEDRYSIRLPEDFRSYLLNAAPTSTFMDEIGTQWWSPNEIKSYSDECPNGSPGRINPEIEAEKAFYLVFSDYLIWCYAWSICCSDGPNRGRIAIVGGMPDAFVADSFREFLRLELSDAHEIHIGPSSKLNAAS